MDFTILKDFIDYGGMFVIAIGAFWWVLKVDIPKRESRFERQQESERKWHKEDRDILFKTFNTEHQEILEQLRNLSQSMLLSSKTCAVNRSLGMIEYLMSHETGVDFDLASRKVREYWKLNGIDLKSEDIVK